MAKTKISEFSANPANNTDIDNINIAEGCAPSGINDAIRELMAQLKDFQAGTAGDAFNGPVGTTTAAAGAFTTLTTSSTVTHNSGTANGVTYLNGSKVLTAGSALTFDGTQLNVPAGAAATPSLSTTTDANTGVFFPAADALAFTTGGNERGRFDSTGKFGIGTNNPIRTLDVAGDASFIDGIKIDPSTGTASVAVEVGAGRSGNGASVVDLIGDATYTDYGLRIIRNAGGPNTDSAIEHRGAGSLNLRTIEVAPIVFSTSNTDRGRFTSDGKFIVGGSSAGSNTGKLHVYGGISGESLIAREGLNGTSDGSNFNFWWTGSQAQLWVDTTNVGTISLTSDYRIKKDIETQTAPAIERVMQLRPVTYQITDYGTVFKADGKQREGFIAHELQAVIPSGVDGEKDDPSQVQSLRMDAVVSVLTKAIQEQQAIITALTARIAALEAA